MKHIVVTTAVALSMSSCDVFTESRSQQSDAKASSCGGLVEADTSPYDFSRYGSNRGNVSFPANNCCTGALCEFDDYSTNMGYAVELHMVGIYEATSDHGSIGEFDVRVERAGASWLILSSYEPVHWTVHAAEGASIERVLLTGYHEQTATVPEGTVVDTLTVETTGDYFGVAYAWPTAEELDTTCEELYPADECESADDLAIPWWDLFGYAPMRTAQVVDRLEAHLGRQLTSFAGCYQMSQVTIGEGDQGNVSFPSNNCSTDAGYEFDVYSTSTGKAVELHMVGIYEATSNHGSTCDQSEQPEADCRPYHTDGEFDVHVERTGVSWLILSSFEPVHWTVHAAGGASIERVLLTGYHEQTATVPEGTIVETLTYETTGDYFGVAYVWPTAEELDTTCEELYPADECELADDLGIPWWELFDYEPMETVQAVGRLEAHVGRRLTSFAGCYQMSQLTIGAGEDPEEPEEPYCDDPCAGTEGQLGAYFAGLCGVGGGFIRTQDISCKDALQNCLTNDAGNPTIGIYCEWNGVVIHRNDLDEDACVDEYGPAPECSEP